MTKYFSVVMHMRAKEKTATLSCIITDDGIVLYQCQNALGENEDELRDDILYDK
ncbi:hypothetical protein FQR65_LT13360 [Abscondita terminalis]|nr:hypothetical protein FQR65_LT13360 [Abscondita terminalis]